MNFYIYNVQSINYKNDFYVQGIVQMYIRKKGTSKIMQG